MRPPPLSNCERNFILQSFIQNLRIDGRRCQDFRPIKLFTGSQPGTCLAMLGNTKVLAEVSCSLAEPRSTRPNQGIIDVQLNMSPIAAPNNETNRLGSRGLEILRTLELLLRDSCCIDVESLCVRAGKQVWQINVQVTVLDDCGSLLDCGSMAAITALSHFRRPDCTVTQDSVIVHAPYERVTIPLNVYHMPVCVTFGLTENGKCVSVDPCDREELCLDATLVIACNKRQEVCALTTSGNIALSQEMVESCVTNAMARALDLTELIQTVLKDDRMKRARHERVSGFENLLNMDLLSASHYEPNLLIAPAIIVPIDLPVTSIDQTTMDGAVHICRPGLPSTNERQKPGVKQETQEEDSKQLEAIISQQQMEKSQRLAAKKKEQRRMNEMLDDLLDGEETVDAQPVALQSTPMETSNRPDAVNDDNDDQVDLSRALKRKKTKP